jgi:hypothetical protein
MVTLLGRVCSNRTGIQLQITGTTISGAAVITTNDFASSRCIFVCCVNGINITEATYIRVQGDK